MFTRFDKKEVFVNVKNWERLSVKEVQFPNLFKFRAKSYGNTTKFFFFVGFIFEYNTTALHWWIDTQIYFTSTQ